MSNKTQPFTKTNHNKISSYVPIKLFILRINNNHLVEVNTIYFFTPNQQNKTVALKL